MAGMLFLFHGKKVCLYSFTAVRRLPILAFKEISLSFSGDIAEKVISDLLLDRLRDCISLLTVHEQQLIRQHYYDEISEVELSKKYGILQQAVSKRLKKVRAKLKNLLEQ